MLRPWRSEPESRSTPSIQTPRETWIMGRSTLAAGGGRPLYSKRRCLRNQHLEIRGWILPKFPYLRQKSAGWPTDPRTEIDTTKHTTSRPPSLCVQTYHLSPTTSGTTSKSRRAHSRARPLAQSSTHDSALDRLKQQPPLVAAIVVGCKLACDAAVEVQLTVTPH